jgi:hypothetical protein
VSTFTTASWTIGQKVSTPNRNTWSVSSDNEEQKAKLREIGINTRIEFKKSSGR